MQSGCREDRSSKFARKEMAEITKQWRELQNQVCRFERYGRHEETRTPDLYRVNLPITNTFKHLQVAGDCLTTTKDV
jgi:hypothetical protein